MGVDVNCGEAWKLCTGNPSIVVAVLDEGVICTTILTWKEIYG